MAKKSFEEFSMELINNSSKKLKVKDTNFKFGMHAPMGIHSQNVFFEKGS